MLKFIRSFVTLAVIAGVLTSCGKDSEDAANPAGANTSGAEAVTETADTVDDDWNVSEELQAAGYKASADLPYPVYPNGTQYRTGGENGLTIVLFQTEDSFDEVDAYYKEAANMPRLSAMSDYVRYSVDGGSEDPWATDQPGIVIHQFNDEAERDAVGADETALTNIIMSY